MFHTNVTHLHGTMVVCNMQ